MSNDQLHQQQFLDVIDRDEAERRFQAVLDLGPLEPEDVPLAAALHRVLVQDVVAPIDVPGFDRSNVDGFAVMARDTFGASEDRPRTLNLVAEFLTPAVTPTQPLRLGTAMPIATGAVVPRGADAVVMIEHTDADAAKLMVRRPAVPGENLTFAGTDIGRGETVLRRGDWLTSRETSVLAALGLASVAVVRRPRIAIVSTGDELRPPGATLRPGQIFDSNATVLADAVRELGGEPVSFGIVVDDREELERTLRQALACDGILLSGGTSKGAGDLSYRVVADLGAPGIIAHGVALKPGKPLCLAAVRLRGRRTIPVVILPGFPTSAIFTFHEFVAPVIRKLGGRREDAGTVLSAQLPFRIRSERGRTEFLLVSLVPPPGEGAGQTEWTAYPMDKGSGSVTTFSRADGFVVIGRQREYLEAGAVVDVHLLSQGLRPADLVVIGSHCIGVDYLLGRLRDRGFSSKFLAVGSTGGLMAARRGECDLAGIHLFDPKTNIYNRPFLTAELTLVEGYDRLQGIVFRKGDPRFEGRQVLQAVAAALVDADCVLVNRNRGSGTRVLIDRLLGAAQPTGYWTEARSHNAVAAAVAQERADWGVAIAPVAADLGLGFLPLQEECYDFVVPCDRLERPAVQAFRDILGLADTHQALEAMGLNPRRQGPFLSGLAGAG
jgi:putative molybdopterin biosynthesis protein